MGIKEGSLLYRKQITFLSSHDRSTLIVQQRIINQLRAELKMFDSQPMLSPNPVSNPVFV